MSIALLYDVHGNLLALNAVLEDAAAAGADSYLLGGDYAAFGPWPRETVERLQLLPRVRTLTDDVSDWMWALVTKGRASDDGIGPHTDLLTDFPYLGPPHTDGSVESQLRR